ncbi:hypothetical protein OF83DRAFT_1173464 [Amylostereum chailletii]|nr:hypothetical protein OF83DRAFT_1173464 [Amylostereum chailletii]
MFFLKLFLKPKPPTCACGAPAADDESYFCSSACAHNDSFRTLSKVGTHFHYRDTVKRRESDRIPPKNPVSAPRPSAHAPPLPVHPLQATPPPAPFGIYIPLDGRYLPPIASDPFAADPCPSVQGKTSPRPRTGSLPKRAMRPPHGHRHKCKGHGPQATGGPAPSPAPIPPSSRPGLKNSPCSPHSAALRRSRSFAGICAPSQLFIPPFVNDDDLPLGLRPDVLRRTEGAPPPSQRRRDGQ